MFNITSKYFSFFSNSPPASWVAHIARDFFTCYSCSYYSSMLRAKKGRPNIHYNENIDILPKLPHSYNVVIAARGQKYLILGDKLIRKWMKIKSKKLMNTAEVLVTIFWENGMNIGCLRGMNRILRLQNLKASNVLRFFVVFSRYLFIFPTYW